tara:strand:+ start:530 stop:967 length:438 start_codon:yes stop_codon:yes gene_type:complete
MGGGKSSKQENKVEIDPRLEKASLGTLGGALSSASLDYQPNRGVTVAAFAPQQMAAMQGSNQMADALGLGSAPMTSYLPRAQDAGNGIMGYGSGGIYDQTLAASTTAASRRKQSDILRNYGQLGAQLTREAMPPPPILSRARGGK